MAYRDLSELPRGRLTMDEAVSIAQAFAAAAFETISVYRTPMGDCSLEGRYWYAGGRPVAKLDEIKLGDMMAGFVLTEKPATPEALYRHVTARGVPLDPVAFLDLPLCMQVAYDVFVRTLPPLAGEVAKAEAERRAAELAKLPPPPDTFKKIYHQPSATAKIWDADVSTVAAKKANGKAVRA